MQKASRAILKEIEEIASKWELKPNGNYYNPKISATVYKNKNDEWKFIHETPVENSRRAYKKGAKTAEATISLCFADYLISGSDYANDLINDLTATNLSVEQIIEATGLSDDHINQFIQQPQNENNLAHRLKKITKQTTEKLPPLDGKLIDWDEVLKEELRTKTSFRKDRPLDNKPTDIIDSWITMEVLSPDTYKKPSDKCQGKQTLTSLTGQHLPWEKTQNCLKNQEAYYQIYIGAVDVKKASTRLLELYKDDTEERLSKSGYATIAVATIDAKGILVEDQNDISLSSFPWGYGRAVNNKLEHLRCWHAADGLLSRYLREILAETNDKGEELPITWDKIHHAYNFLVQNCNIPEEDCITPTFAIQEYRYQPKKGEKQNTPNAPLLNSFYLNDLQSIQKILATGTPGKALRQYVGDIGSPDLKDLLKDRDLLESTLNPNKTPAGRWPGAGRHPLVLLQQTSVNLATTTLKDGGIFSVNGPPGTGKTTLLRDIIASIIIDRAKALSDFQNPIDAFTRKGTFYKLHDALKGHEIFVASSNNKAVENISKELPQLSQIAEDLTDDLHFFRTISDTLAGKDNKTWGLSAAALGRGENRRTFINSFWEQKDTGLGTYLKAVRQEKIPLITIKDKETDAEIERLPLVITQETIPKNSQEIKENWRKACENFNNALSQYHSLSASIQSLYKTLQKEDHKAPDLEALLSLKESLEKDLSNLEETKKEFQSDLEHEEIQLKSLEEQRKNYQHLKPSLFDVGTYKLKRAFRYDTKSPWGEEYDQCLLTLTKKQRVVLKLKDDLHKNTKKTKKLNRQHNQIAQDISNAQKTLEKRQHLLTEDFWKRPFNEQQLFSPNFTKEEQESRDDVFVAAIKLHKAFIDGAAQPLGYNIDAMMKVLGGTPLSPEQDSFLPDLWASLFLVVPVASTTFSSVTSMLRGMNEESFGWLLIDEAGQSTPQAAAGAIYRAKRVISVGDPLQIPPVTSLPKPLTESLATHHGVDPKEFTAPQASIQTLCDNANSYGTLLERDLEDVRIGAPLLVHRRCENPMFKISNALAYDDLMVYATAEKASPIKEILGESHWIHVSGTADEKWCKEEGLEALNRIMRLAQELGKMPDLYVISPFKVVGDKMRQCLKDKRDFFEKYIPSIEEWAKNHVGTVHTFQGKEAEAVFLLLGAPDLSQGRARGWATSQVNILNVAISRAKCAFYVIGNHHLWGGDGYMSLFSQHLPRKEFTSSCEIQRAS